MCMAGLEGDLDAARREFAALRSLRDRLAKNCPAGVLLAELSMGMSGDFEAAIEEGATIVRVGSAFFEGLPPIPLSLRERVRVRACGSCGKGCHCWLAQQCCAPVVRHCWTSQQWHPAFFMELA